MTLLDNVVRASNALVIVLGLALLSYGGYVFTVCKSANTVNGAAVGLGVLDVLFGLLIFFAFRNLFVLRLYGLVMGLLVVIELIVSIVFLVDSSKVTNNASTCPADTTFNQAETFKNAGWILLAVAVFQAITLSIVFFQVCMVDRPFDESQYREETLISAGTYSKVGSSDDGVPSAADRYKEKHSSYYSKYGLK